MTETKGTHPVQKPHTPGQARISTAVTLAAYEVYCKVWAPQRELIEGECRGGFGVGELIGLLYTRSFPKEEWRQRFDEAMDSMENMR